jgi:hypothetical protein
MVYGGGPNAVCDICGFVFKLSQLRKQWDGLMVCSEDWSPRHPQDFVRGVPDTQGVRPNMRPRPADYTLTVNEVQAEDL